MYFEGRVYEIEPGQWVVQTKHLPNVPWQTVEGPFKHKEIAEKALELIG